MEPFLLALPSSTPDHVPEMDGVTDAANLTRDLFISDGLLADVSLCEGARKWGRRGGGGFHRDVDRNRYRIDCGGRICQY
jgi:hypothetical protein